MIKLYIVSNGPTILKWDKHFSEMASAPSGPITLQQALNVNPIFGKAL
jgi:hypothetical protein